MAEAAARVQARAREPAPAVRAVEATVRAARSGPAPTTMPAWITTWDDRPPADLFSSQSGLQAKLEVSQPGDPQEQEADRVAERVMRMPDAAATGVQRCACGGIAGAGGECPACRARSLGLQRASAGGVAPTDA